jgi:hypothetical protein
MSDTKLVEDDEELIPVDSPPEDDSRASDDADGDDGDDADDADDDGDERLADSQDDHDEDVASSTNRTRRQKRREIRKRAKDNADRELRFLREQNDALLRRVQAVEGSTLQNNVQSLDQRMQEAMREAQQAETIIARAIEAGNGDDVATAMRLRDEAKQRVQQFGYAKQQVETARQQAARPAPDPRVQTYAREWLEANPWYDPNGRDEDSRITKAIDDGLTAAGYNPASSDYWHELTKRVASRIGSDDAPRSTNPRRKAPPTGNSREHAPVSTKREVYVTPERKQAMMDAGVWDDPVARNKMLKAYQSYDKSSAR